MNPVDWADTRRLNRIKAPTEDDAFEDGGSKFLSAFGGPKFLETTKHRAHHKADYSTTC